ncbi:MAG: RNA polymerase sigma factor (sigma-70 family), partial [Planctomycetota bacterium]
MTPNPQHSGQGDPSASAPRTPSTPGTRSALSSDVVLEHADWLRRLARGLVRDVHEAEDLVQEAFGALATARGPIRDLRAYLAQALRFQGAKRFRSDSRRRRHEALSVDIEPRHQEPSDRLPERMDAMRVVLEEVGRLPAAQARAIGLHYVDGLTVAEVANRLGVEASTVRSQLARGRAALRAKLDTECGGTAAWSLAFAPWCLPDLASAGAMGISVSPTTPTTGAAMGGTAVGGFALMTLAKSLIVILPVLVAAGWFALRDPEPAAASSSAPPPATPVFMEDLGEPSAVALAAAESFPIQGRIVRAMDGTALAGVTVRFFPVKGAVHTSRATVDPRPEAVTDENGRFLVPSQAWTARTVRIVVQDGSYYLDLEQEELAFPFEGDIEVVCGPTFELRYRGEYVNPRLPANATVSDSTTNYSVATREGTLPWVRFMVPLPTDAEELRVEAEGNFVFGQGRIDDPSGANQGPIDIEFEEGGALEFRHVDGTPPPMMRVVLRKLDSPSASPEEVHFLKRTGQAERLALATHLVPGSYRWDLKFGAADVGGVVEVKPGEWTRLTVGADLAAAMDATVEIDVTNAPGV